MIDNFSWKKGTAVITINAAGVYRIEAALYCGIDGEAYLLLNGEPIAVFSKQFGEKVTCLKSRGSVFSEPVLLPAKAKVSVRVNCAFFGQAYLRIHKV